MKKLAAAVVIFVLSAACSFAQEAAPYAGLQKRRVKSLSEEKIRDYLGGSGMGLALPAELNRYPGPKHVLELAEDLSLTDEQRAMSQLVFEKMDRDAKRLGKSIVEGEAALDGLFETGTIDEDQLATTLDGLAELEARLRYTHLVAHLEMIEILSEEQVVRYTELRGYAEPSPSHQGHSMKH